MSDSIFVDGAAEPVRTADGRTWLFPTTVGTWYFARSPVIASGPDGHPVLGLVRKRRLPSGGPAVTDGGAFSVQVELVASAPDTAEELAWTQAVAAHSGEPPVFAPLPVRAGRMTTEVAGRASGDPPDRLGAAVSAVADLLLDAAEADAFAAALGSGAGPPLTLRFEHRYDVGRPADDGMELGVVELRRSISLADLPDLDPSTHLVDVTGEGTMPLLITSPPDQRVRRYAFQYGYRRPDGTTGGGSGQSDGPDGLRVHDRIRWEPAGDPPSSVELRYAVDWIEPDWPPWTGTVVLATGAPCLSYRISPALSIAEVALRSDLGCAGPGSFATISWEVVQVGPDRPPRRSGSILIEGAEPPDGLIREVITFAAAPVTVFTWTAELVRPDGTTLVGQGGFVLGERTEAEVLRVGLAPPWPARR